MEKKSYTNAATLLDDPDIFNFDTKYEPEPLLNSLWRFFNYSIWDAINPRYLSYKISNFWFKIRHGWSIKDLWSLNSAFSKWIIPILEFNHYKYQYLPETNIPLTIHLSKKYWKILQSFYMTNARLIGGWEYFNPIKKEGLTLFTQLLIENPNFGEDVADWWVKRLIEFPKKLHGWPCNLSSYVKYYSKFQDQDETFDSTCLEIWKKIIKKIDLAFVLLRKKQWTEDELRTMKKGFSLWVKYFDDLWD